MQLIVICLIITHTVTSIWAVTQKYYFEKRYLSGNYQTAVVSQIQQKSEFEKKKKLSKSSNSYQFIQPTPPK